MEKMKRNEIIKHYKSFFGLENTGLGEDDHLIIDWAESLMKDYNLENVSQSICPHCGSDNYAVTDNRWCLNCDEPFSTE